MPRKDRPRVELPSWAVVKDKRRKHVGRVVALLEQWARAMRLSAEERDAWMTAGLLHDALRDAPEPLLRELSGDATTAAELLHGPAAAKRAERDGEHRADVLDAVRYHTIGKPGWSRTGRALFMADFLEPKRKFLRRKRAAIARRVPKDFDGAFRDVLRMKIERALGFDGDIYPETAALWNATVE